MDFIADFANWDNSTVPEYLQTSRALTQTAHEALGGEQGSRPLVVDPFAGGGAIPLEALRVGADAFASDLNPVAVLLNKMLLEILPNCDSKIVGKMRYWGRRVKEEALKQIQTLYPTDSKGQKPVAFIWGRTVRCEGPGCGAELPLIGQVWLSKKPKNITAFGLTVNQEKKLICIRVLHNPRLNEVMAPISQKSSATCPVCGYTTPAKNVRLQLEKKFGGTDRCRLLAVIVTHPARKGKLFREPNYSDLEAVKQSKILLAKLTNREINGLPLIPDEDCPPEGALGFRFQKYGIRKWRELYTPRQLVALGTLAEIISGRKLRVEIEREEKSDDDGLLIRFCLAFALGRTNDLSASLCRWLPSLEAIAATNGGQNKMPIILDFAESNPFGGSGGDYEGQIDWIARVVEHQIKSKLQSGATDLFAAQNSVLPDDIADAFITDPPYYDAFGYSDLSEFFFVWLRRTLQSDEIPYHLSSIPKKEELISIGKTLLDNRGIKNDSTYQQGMTKALYKHRAITKPNGIATVVFANKSTKGWEALLQAIVDAGWVVTASWPIDTERQNRQRAIGSAALQSSIHLVCRPRENPDGSLRTDDIGDWRDVLAELPKRIHDWMPRLADEGVVGADAIFACLGPALEIYSRYSSVEKASGEKVELKEYLEQVWAAVSREALKMIFEGADASGFEEDARLTAMWLWTLRTAANGNNKAGNDAPAKSLPGYIEYDAARKIAQGLGAHLENLSHLVEIKGNTAMLLSAGARTRYLFGKDAGESPKGRKKKKTKQLTFDFEGELKQMEEESGDWAGDLSARAGSTVLDQLHQSMILFGAGRGEALKRFLVDDGIGMNPLYWRLAQALSALYPSGTDEKRWVDGVLARKKGLGF